MKIRQMQRADLESVVENEFSAYAFPWTRGIFEDCLKAGNECWVADSDGVIVGHAVVSVGAGEAHLLNVCVARSKQGRGFGRALVLHALERAHRRGADALGINPIHQKAVVLDLEAFFRQRSAD